MRVLGEIKKKLLDPGDGFFPNWIKGLLVLACGYVFLVGLGEVLRGWFDKSEQKTDWEMKCDALEEGYPALVQHLKTKQGKKELVWQERVWINEKNELVYECRAGEKKGSVMRVKDTDLDHNPDMVQNWYEDTFVPLGELGGFQEQGPIVINWVHDMNVAISFQKECREATPTKKEINH